MIVGQQDLFAIECMITRRTAGWTYGRLRLWFGGLSLGEFSEEFLGLVGTTGVIRETAQSVPILEEDLTITDLLRVVRQAHYGSRPYDHSEAAKWQPYLWIGYCEGFEEIFSVIARVGEEVRVAWHNDQENQIHEQVVPYQIFSTVCSEFVAWLDQEKVY